MIAGPGDAVDTAALDVAVIGGGPAGMIAAERLAAAGRRVVLFDAMGALGRKFLLAGRGGLNLTHSEAFDRFVTRYGEAASWLEPMLRSFDAEALVAWCEGLDQPTFIGSSGRVFPVEFRANALLAAWEQRLRDRGVEIRLRHRWLGWDDRGRLRFEGFDPVGATATVLALGGASWPGTGSDGAWVDVLRDEGTAVEPLRPANSGFVVDWSEIMVREFAGTPVKNVGVRVGDTTARGELMITDTGLEGGALYAVSRELRRAVDADAQAGAVLLVDLLPDLEAPAIARRLAGRRPKDSMSTVLRRHLGLDAAKVALLREATANVLPADDDALVDLVRAVPVRVLAPEGIDRAISTSGGVRLDELDEHLMLVRRPGTFMAGEMLDWDAPTGGYLLQASFSTGVAAADGALRWLELDGGTSTA